MEHRAGQPHRPTPLRLDDQREIDLARVRAGRLTGDAIGEPSPARLDRVAPDDPRAQALYRKYVRDEVLIPLGIPFTEESLTAESPPLDLAPPSGELLLVLLGTERAAIGGVRHLDTPVAEVKSMYVAPPFRGQGLGRTLLRELESIAAARGCTSVRLDTAAHLTPAIALYRSLGYREIPAYSDGPNAEMWFEHELGTG